LSIPQPAINPLWKVRPLRNDDLNGVAELARAVYGKSALTDVSYLDWKFNRNPSGKAIVAVCDCQGQIIGVAGLFPQTFKIGSSVWRGAWGGDVMVHPQFRRHGIFIAVMGAVFEWAARDVAFAYTTRSRKSPPIRGVFKYFEIITPGGIFARTKCIRILPTIGALSVSLEPTLTSLMQHAGTIRELISFAPVENLTNNSGFPAPFSRDESIRVRKLDSLVFGEEFENLWEEVKDSLPIAVVKDRTYLNWRYANPTGSYIGFRAEKNGALCGYALLAFTMRRRLKTAWVAELLAVNPEVAIELVEACLECARQEHAHIFKMWETKETRALAGRLGFKKTWHKEPIIVHVLDSKLPKNLVGNIDNWCINFGDTEDWM